MIYLYKYLFKGASKAKFRLTNADDVSDKDEITLYIRGRYLCSGKLNYLSNMYNCISNYITVDAMWRTLGNQTYPSPDPSVFEVKVKTPEDVELLLQKGKASDFIIYLNRRHTDVQLKYPEFFKKYVWSYKKPAKYNDLTCYTIQIPRIAKPIYISQRDSNRRCITRMGMLYPTAGEIWYERQLLLHYETSSFIQLRTINGIVYQTFQEAAVACGLVNDQNEVITCFMDILYISTPLEKRSLFLVLTLQVLTLTKYD